MAKQTLKEEIITLSENNNQTSPLRLSQVISKLQQIYRKYGDGYVSFSTDGDLSGRLQTLVDSVSYDSSENTAFLDGKLVSYVDPKDLKKV